MEVRGDAGVQIGPGPTLQQLLCVRPSGPRGSGPFSKREDQSAGVNGTFLVEFLGWSQFFVFSTILGLPGIFILFWMKKKFPLEMQKTNFK